VLPACHYFSGKMLNTHEPKVVNGPEIMSKVLGESEGKMRELFKDAESDAAAEQKEAAAVAAAAAAAAAGEPTREEAGGEEDGEDSEPEEKELRFQATGNADGTAEGNTVWESLLGEMKEKLQHQRDSGGGGGARKRRKRGGGGGSTGPRKIHLIIFDEIDSLVKARGRGSGNAADSVYDGITNTQGHVGKLRLEP
jgi:hypothetical protein